MTENNKPEWFQIAENDGPAVPPKASKTLPFAAVMATALILGVGAVVAQVQEESPAMAVDTASVQTTVSSSTASPTLVAQVSNPATSAAIASTSELQNPSIAQLPTKTEDDDHEGRSHRGDHDDEDEDEGDDD
jgi:hypothetical protein